MKELEEQILAFITLTPLALKRDLYYRFFMAMAGPAYRQDRIYWQDFIRANP